MKPKATLTKLSKETIELRKVGKSHTYGITEKLLDKYRPKDGYSLTDKESKSTKQKKVA